MDIDKDIAGKLVEGVVIKITRCDRNLTERKQLEKSSDEFKKVGEDCCPKCGVGGLIRVNHEIEAYYKGVVGSENQGEITCNDFYRCYHKCENIYYEVLSKETRK